MSSIRGRMTLLSLAVILTLAACGGGDGAGAQTTGATETISNEETPTTGAPAAPETTEAGDDSGADDGFSGLSGTCLEATQAMTAAMSSYSTGVAGAMSGTLDGDELQLVAEQLEAMASAAPAEIQDDVAVIAEELGAFYTAIADTGYTGTGTPTPDQLAQLEALSEAIDQEAFDNASANLEAWFEANCG